MNNKYSKKKESHKLVLFYSFIIIFIAILSSVTFALWPPNDYTTKNKEYIIEYIISDPDSSTIEEIEFSNDELTSYQVSTPIPGVIPARNKYSMFKNYFYSPFLNSNNLMLIQIFNTPQILNMLPFEKTFYYLTKKYNNDASINYNPVPTFSNEGTDNDYQVLYYQTTKQDTHEFTYVFNQIYEHENNIENIQLYRFPGNLPKIKLVEGYATNIPNNYSLKLITPIYPTETQDTFGYIKSGSSSITEYGNGVFLSGKIISTSYNTDYFVPSELNEATYFGKDKVYAPGQVYTFTLNLPTPGKLGSRKIIGTATIPQLPHDLEFATIDFISAPNFYSNNEYPDDEYITSFNIQYDVAPQVTPIVQVYYKTTGNWIQIENIQNNYPEITANLGHITAEEFSLKINVTDSETTTTYEFTPFAVKQREITSLTGSMQSINKYYYPDFPDNNIYIDTEIALDGICIDSQSELCDRLPIGLYLNGEYLTNINLNQTFQGTIFSEVAPGIHSFDFRYEGIQDSLYPNNYQSEPFELELFNPFPPEVTLLGPADNAPLTQDELNFDYMVTDDMDTVNVCYLQIYASGQYWTFGYVENVQTNISQTITYWTGFEEESFIEPADILATENNVWRIRCYDYSNFYDTSEERTFDFIDESTTTTLEESTTTTTTTVESTTTTTLLEANTFDLEIIPTPVSDIATLDEQVTLTYYIRNNGPNGVSHSHTLSIIKPNGGGGAASNTEYIESGETNNLYSNIIMDQVGVWNITITVNPTENDTNITNNQATWIINALQALHEINNADAVVINEPGYYDINVSLNQSTSGNITTNFSFLTNNYTWWQELGLRRFININPSQEIIDSLETVILTIYYTDEELNGIGYSDSTIKMMYFNPETSSWIEVTEELDWVDSVVKNTETNSISATIHHFSEYALQADKIFCSDNSQITSPCYHSDILRTSGYICSGSWQSSACTTPPANNGGGGSGGGGGGGGGGARSTTITTTTTTIPNTPQQEQRTEETGRTSQETPSSGSTDQNDKPSASPNNNNNEPEVNIQQESPTERLFNSTIGALVIIGLLGTLGAMLGISIYHHHTRKEHISIPHRHIAESQSFYQFVYSNYSGKEADACNYIDSVMSMGKKEDEIKKTLLEHGWNEEQVQLIFSDYHEVKKEFVLIKSTYTLKHAGKDKQSAIKELNKKGFYGIDVKDAKMLVSEVYEEENVETTTEGHAEEQTKQPQGQIETDTTQSPKKEQVIQ